VSKISQVASISEDIERIESEKEVFLKHPGHNYDAQIKAKDADLAQMKCQEQEIEVLLTTKKKYINQLESLKSGFKEVKSYTFNSILAELTIKSNKYLQELFEVPVTIAFKNDNMKIETVIVHDNIQKGVGLLSGGESVRATLAVDLALSEIVSLRTGSKMNLRIMDEYFRFLSEESMEKCLRLLEKLGGSTILIEHNSVFKSIVDQTFFIEKSKGTSYISSN
jgi:DNA repair exonuclease SbcCD ATPase subunit